MSFGNGTLATVVASTDTDLTQAGSGETRMIIGISICNYSGADSAVKVLHASSADVLKHYLINNTVVAGQSVFLEFKIPLVSQEKIRVNSIETDVSFEAAYLIP